MNLNHFCRFNGHPGIKASTEAQGVPHTEVDLIVVNGDSVGFGCQLMQGDRVSVYPAFKNLGAIVRSGE